jgi:uncharacterized membrane protein
LLQEILNFFGRAICHQLEDRSLYASGKTLSVCARDTGIYIGIFSTLIYLHLTKRKRQITVPSIKISFFLLLFMVPMMVDGLGSSLHFFESNNLRRLVSGASFGLVLPYFLYPLVLSGAIEKDSEPVVKRSLDMVLPLALCIVLGGLVYGGLISFYVIDSLVILTIIIWVGLLGSALFKWVRNIRLKWILTGLTGLGLLSFLSLLHVWAYSYTN